MAGKAVEAVEQVEAVGKSGPIVCVSAV